MVHPTIFTKPIQILPHLLDELLPLTLLPPLLGPVPVGFYKGRQV